MKSNTIKSLFLASLVIGPNIAYAESNLACVTPVLPDASVEFRILDPETGASQLVGNLIQVDSLNTSAVTRQKNALYLVARTAGSSSDELVQVNLSTGAHSQVPLDVEGIHTLYISKKSRLMAFVKNPLSGSEELRQVDPNTGSTIRVNGIEQFDQPQPGVMAWANSKAVVQVSKNASESTFRMFKVHMNLGSRLSQYRLRFR
ncbi:MAG: hypothetical protein K1X79_09220, partial [Oligoflexia bacterium]|nr:hypothetical protein [Oligoflexia bacterium]